MRQRTVIFINARLWLLAVILGGCVVFAAGCAANLAKYLPGADKNTGQYPDDGKLRIIAIGAHPDDCELSIGGAAALWAAQGHHVKFVCVTNGEIGHWRMKGPKLAARRKKEVENAAKILGIETTRVLNNPDGQLMPTLKNRLTIARLIRQWKADIVLTHIPQDYHPDHRYTSILVQDAAYLVTVPFMCPDVPHLQKNPVFLYWVPSYRLIDTSGFAPDAIIAVDKVIHKKLAAALAMESQFIEGGVSGNEQMVPHNKAEYAKRSSEVREQFTKRFETVANKYRQQLTALYGPEKGSRVRFAEAFQVCPFGSGLSPAQLKELFGFAQP
ncbi:MAG TPA: PIG-L family deacetylase [Sedimentisphaerales bacterium]|nr:PIG-L family deacetylase [Sedimentisphaerales bacterium]